MSHGKKEAPRELRDRLKEARLWNSLWQGWVGHAQKWHHPILRPLPGLLVNVSWSLRCSHQWDPGEESWGILLPKMGRKSLSKYFSEDPEFNLEPRSNMFIFRVEKKDCSFEMELIWRAICKALGSVFSKTEKFPIFKDSFSGTKHTLQVHSRKCFSIAGW